MLLSHIIGIFAHPGQEWKIIRSEHHSKSKEFMQHTPILALIPAICGYIGVTQVGWVFNGSSKAFLTAYSALNLSLTTYFTLMAGVWILGEFINWVVTINSDEKIDPHHGIAMAVYVTTPLFLIGFVSLYPDILVNVIATCIAASYSVYLIYEGMPILMNIPKERAFLYSTAVIIVSLAMVVAVRVITVLIWSWAVGPVFMS